MTTARRNERLPTENEIIKDEKENGDGPSARDPLIGQVIAEKYEIGEMLGEGAMGRVYRARQVALDKDIAVKVLHRHLTGDARITRRFHREARAASRLAHPNSLQILDFGATDDGVLYIAMELLDGEDLQTIIDHDFPFPPARVAALVVPVLRALEEAHRAGIIHRDLKPENVIVLSDRSGHEHVKVCDFGIAKILDGEEGQTITVDGFVCGTPQYMAPEQARGDVIDHLCDIYAMGVVLYQMLCGVVPFSGDNTLKTITKHVMDAPVTPRHRRRDLRIPPGLEAVCLRSLAKDPAERWPSAAAMADALEEAVAALGPDALVTPVSIPPPSEPGPEPETSTAAPSQNNAPSARHAGLWPIGMAVAVLLIGAVVMSTRQGAEHEGMSAELARAATPPPPVSPALESGREQEAVPSPSHEEFGVPPTPSITPEPSPSVPVDERSTRRIRSRQERNPATHDSSAVDETRESASRSPVAAETAESHVATPFELAFDEGRRLFLANDVPGAIAHFEEAARIMPRDADVQKQLGRAYMRAGDAPRSIAAYRRYLSLAPNASDGPVIERIIAQHGP
jgi:serine/threonine-protein kinase